MSVAPEQDALRIRLTAIFGVAKRRPRIIKQQAGIFLPNIVNHPTFAILLMDQESLRFDAGVRPVDTKLPSKEG